jgi:hypothetical protein
VVNDLKILIWAARSLDSDRLKEQLMHEDAPAQQLTLTSSSNQAYGMLNLLEKGRLVLSPNRLIHSTCWR